MANWLIGLLALLAVGKCDREQQFKVKMDCQKFGTGQYVFGCNPHYWVCVNNEQQYELRCFGDLVLDPDENRCNYREKVRLCTDPNLTHNEPYRVLELFTCNGRPNGSYSTGYCDSYYYTCNDGSKTENPCPAKRYFNNKTKKCDRKEKVGECKNLMERPLAQPAEPANKPAEHVTLEKVNPSPRPIPRIIEHADAKKIGLDMSYISSNANNSGQTQPSNNKVELAPDCSQLPDGSYENDVDQCSNMYWKCSNKLVSRSVCPEGLVFNKHSQECDYDQSVPACSASHVKSAIMEDIFTAGLNAPVMPVIHAQQQLPGFNCTGRLNGIYILKPCQPNYFHCAQGVARVKTCAPGTVFDSHVLNCRSKSECATVRLPRGVSHFSPLEHGNFDFMHQKLLLPTETANPDCRGRTDGFYEIGRCQQNYVKCSAGNPIPHTCPENLVFFGNLCDNLQSCLNPPVAVAPGYAPPDTFQEQDYDTYSVRTTKSSPDMWCRQNNKPDGFHGVGCTRYFYSCTFGFSQRIPCPSDLFYDADKHQCDQKQFIVACGGKKPTATATPQLDVKYPITAPNPWCTTHYKSDGVHAAGCRNYFYACNAGVTTKLTCPIGLFFDPEELQCMDRKLIHICGGHKPKPTQMAPAEPTPEPDMWCIKNYKSDGFHGVGCANYFYACSNGISTRIDCPVGLYYDVKLNECSKREWVPKCGGQRPEPTILPPMDPYRPIVPVDYFCTKHSLLDGIHAIAGCTSYFYMCTGGNSARINCPVGTYYDSEVQQCAERSAVPACGGSRPLPTAYAQTSPTKAPDSWCQQHNKPDGFHAVGCATHFYSCSSGYSVRAHCPSGLYYDPGQNECNNKEFIPTCGGKIPEPTILPPMEPPRYTTPPDPFCKKYQLPDGIHAVHGCTDYYYNCVGGYSIRTNCPAGLFYDSGIQQCTNKNWVPTCGGKRPLPTTSAPPSLYPTNPPDTFCRDHKLIDGLHAVGCNRFFYACNAGHSVRLDCPSSLFFDVEEGQCLNQAWIKACGGKKPAATTYIPQLYPTNQPDTFCQDNQLPNGIHGIGCKNYFYACNAGFSTRLSCAGGTFFDPKTKQCDNREWITECGGQRTTVDTPYYNDNYGAYGRRKIAGYSTIPKSTTPPDMWCKENRKPDGMHAVGCSHRFYACSGGFTTRLNCPAGLHFDEREQECSHKEWIVSCGGQTPTTTPVMNPTGPATPPDTWCQQTNKPDGLHADGCKSHFYSCNGGISTKLQCPVGLYYDPELKQCTQRSWIVECGGQKPVTNPPSLTSPTPQTDTWCQKYNKPNGFHHVGCASHFYSCAAGISVRIKCPAGLFFDPDVNECNLKEYIPTCGGQKPKPTVLPPMVYTSPPDPFCSKHNLPDGIHSVKGCSNFFYTCNAGYSTRITCPLDLFYDAKLQQCTNRDSIPHCGGSRPVSTTADLPYAAPTSPPDMWCQQNGKSDGFHSVGCAKYFYSCSGGFSVRINCPQGLYYDSHERECNSKEFIPKCGGQRPEPTNPPSTYVNIPQAPLDTHCRAHRLKDGLHGVGCQNFFYSCSGGFSTKIYCPTNLYYDSELEQCTNQNWIPVCGGTRPVPTTESAYLNPTVRPETFCKVHNLPDGLHGVKCNTYFYACTGGLSTKLQCPTGLHFDVEAQECTNRAWISACGGSKPPPTTNQPQYYPVPQNNWCRENSKNDGIHSEQGCVTYFYMCSEGFTSKTDCPSGLFYDAEVQQCNNKHLVVACGGKKPKSSKYTTKFNVPQEAQPLNPDSTNNKCMKLPDGIYGRKCSRHFFICKDNLTNDFICPNNKAYDARVNQCVASTEISSCISVVNQDGRGTQY